MTSTQAGLPGDRAGHASDQARGHQAGVRVPADVHLLLPRYRARVLANNGASVTAPVPHTETEMSLLKSHLGEGEAFNRELSHCSEDQQLDYEPRARVSLKPILMRLCARYFGSREEEELCSELCGQFT